MSDEREPTSVFDEALRDWAARPPSRSAAAAARELAARRAALDAARTPGLSRPRWAWTAAGLALAVGIAGLVGFGQTPRGPAVETGHAQAVAGLAASPSGPALAEGQVLIWLDADTPLYMNFAPPAEGLDTGGGS